jgi:hypothetical protein
METLVAITAAMLLVAQSGPPIFGKAQIATIEARGRVVRYDSISNAGTANADMIVLLSGNDGFVRLLYSPFDFGWDAPPATADQLLPQSMFTDGKLTWQFRVRDARNPEERARCSSFPKKGIYHGDGHLKLVSPYVAVPGNKSLAVPRAKSLPCRIIVGWKRE